ncbi:DNA polymerase theta [Larimichthys crocea]|uniref:Uncharacterized protein n=1 Tax=Larimichthys crocea TaxID=215358 RepID=A0ACD3RXU5_LARCR|nr:DNA polymerase theta [Larimichthys crocea]
MNQAGEAEQIREEEMLEAAAEQDKDANEGSNRLESPDNACPRFNMSITDSQMELILNASHQISPDNAAEDKDEGGDEDAASESVNRSSSFLFDSLYDSSLLAGLSSHQLLDKSDEEECVARETGDELRLPSTQERRHSELLANQEAERQEAIQWGESSFNLSEWGDSLLVGEHFLERQSLLKHTERTPKEQEGGRHTAQQPNADHVRPDELSESQPKPNQMQPQPATSTENEYGENKTSRLSPLSRSTSRLPRRSGDGNQQTAKSSKSRPGCSDHPSEADAQQLVQKQLPAPRSSSKTKLQTLSPPRVSAPPSTFRPKPPSDGESPVTDEGFTLQLSQDASLSSSNSGTFSIIDVASDRRLFDTFVNEWKTKERYSLALACEKREHREQPEGETGGKHRRASAAHQKLHSVDGFPVRDSDGLVLIGLSVCWGARDAYYMSLQQEQRKGLSASLGSSSSG